MPKMQSPYNKNVGVTQPPKIPNTVICLFDVNFGAQITEAAANSSLRSPFRWISSRCFRRFVGTETIAVAATNSQNATFDELLCMIVAISSVYSGLGHRRYPILSFQNSLEAMITRSTWVHPPLSCHNHKCLSARPVSRIGCQWCTRNGIPEQISQDNGISFWEAHQQQSHVVGGPTTAGTGITRRRQDCHN